MTVARRPEFDAARAPQRADEPPHLLARGRPGGGVLQSARPRRARRVPAARCRRTCRCTGSASAATCWCATAASRASSSRRTARSIALERLNETHGVRRGGRRLRAHRAAVRQVGPGPGGVLRRHSRHARRRARHERRRVRRRDLAPRARGRDHRSPAAASTRARPASTRSATATWSRRPPDEWFLGARAAASSAGPARTRREVRDAAGSGARPRSRSASGAAARCSPTRRAITPRASSKRRPQGLPHRRRLGVAEARQLHHQSRAARRPRTWSG